MPDSPDTLMTRFEEGARGESDVDMVDVLWDIITDIRDSYRLAMETTGLSREARHEVETTVTDYVLNHYGDSGDNDPTSKPSILGRERFIIDAVAKALLDGVKTRHDYTPLRESRRGSCFDLDYIDSDGAKTGHIVRVDVTLDRWEHRTAASNTTS